MSRKSTILALAAIVSLGTFALSSTSASAFGHGGGLGGGAHMSGGAHMGGFHAGGFRSGGFRGGGFAFRRIVRIHPPHWHPHYRFGWRRPYWIAPVVTTGIASYATAPVCESLHLPDQGIHPGRRGRVQGPVHQGNGDEPAGESRAGCHDGAATAAGAGLRTAAGPAVSAVSLRPAAQGRSNRKSLRPRPRAGVLFLSMFRPESRARSASAVMHGEPDRGLRRIGPFDAMTPVGRDMHVVAGRHPRRRAFALEHHQGGARKHDHPFGLRLVVPEARRARLDRATRRARSADRATTTGS